MKLHTTLTALSVSAALFCATASAEITGTSSAEMTIETEITDGTCNAHIVDGSGKATDTIAFGDVYKSEINQKTREEPFKILFTECSGVSSAEVHTEKGPLGCSGDSGDGESYAAGQNAAFELRDVGGNQLYCSRKFAIVPSAIINGAGEMDLDARIVVAKGKEIADVGTGQVSTTITFLIIYQ